MESTLRLCPALMTLSREGSLSLYDKDLVNTYVDQAQSVFGYPRWYQICFWESVHIAVVSVNILTNMNILQTGFLNDHSNLKRFYFRFFLSGFQGDYHVNIKVNENASGRLLTCLDLQLSVTEHKEPSGWLFGRRKRRSQN